MEKINIAKILSKGNLGIILYSPLLGDVKLISTSHISKDFPIRIESVKHPEIKFSLTKYGTYSIRVDGECLLFPSKTNHDWRTRNKVEFENDFEPFEKVLCRDENKEPWNIDLYSHFDENLEEAHVCFRTSWRYCVKYEGNEHLLNKQ